MSYNIRTQKWGDPTRGTESGEIEWSMDLSGGLQMVSGFSMADFSGAMQAAFDKWESVANIDFTYVGSSGGEIDVDMAFLSGSTVGRATWNGGSVINWGQVEMDTEVRWSPYGGAGGTSFYAVALHEIGHIIGFNHVSDTSEIMNGYISTNDLGDGDIEGARVLYGNADGDPTPALPPSSSDETPVSPSPAPSEGGGGDDGGGGGGGAILGILALLGLVFSAIFGFGGGGSVLAAAATAAPEDEHDSDDDDEDMAADACECDGACTCGHTHDDDQLVYTHNVYLNEADLIAAEGADWVNHDHNHADHDHNHASCDHDGPCDCHLNSETSSENVMLLTDIIPVTGMLEEHSCGLELAEEDLVEEDLLDYV